MINFLFFIIQILMKSKTSQRPITITMLATTMVGASIILIIDRLFNFYIYRLLEENVPLANSNSINLQFISEIAFLGFGVVPILGSVSHLLETMMGLDTKFVFVDKQTDDNIVHQNGFRKANRLSG